jgi:hypothetical protein
MSGGRIAVETDIAGKMNTGIERNIGNTITNGSNATASIKELDR